MLVFRNTVRTNCPTVYGPLVRLNLHSQRPVMVYRPTINFVSTQGDVLKASHACESVQNVLRLIVLKLGEGKEYYTYVTGACAQGSQWPATFHVACPTHAHKPFCFICGARSG
jgi:hypothetical protein